MFDGNSNQDGESSSCYDDEVPLDVRRREEGESSGEEESDESGEEGSDE